MNCLGPALLPGPGLCPSLQPSSKDLLALSVQSRDNPCNLGRRQLSVRRLLPAAHPDRSLSGLNQRVSIYFSWPGMENCPLASFPNFGARVCCII